MVVGQGKPWWGCGEECLSGEAGLWPMSSAHPRNWGGGDCRHPAGDQASRPTEGWVLGMVGQPGDSNSQQPSHFLLPPLLSSVLKLSLPLFLSLLVATIFSSVYFSTILFSFCCLCFVIWFFLPYFSFSLFLFLSFSPFSIKRVSNALQAKRTEEDSKHWSKTQSWWRRPQPLSSSNSTRRCGGGDQIFPPCCVVLGLKTAIITI